MQPDGRHVQDDGELFDRRVASLGTRVGDHATLRFDRWNLTAIVERVKASLLTPSRIIAHALWARFAWVSTTPLGREVDPDVN